MVYEPERRNRFRIVAVVVMAFFVVITASAQYIVRVQVVDLLVSINDQHGNFITQVAPEDFLVYEDKKPQEVIGIEQQREPFSIGILLDTSSSMHSNFKITRHATEDFIYSLREEDEFFLMTFDDRLLVRKDFGLARDRINPHWSDYRYGEGTRLYDAVITAVQKLKNAHYPRRALFVISDGMNTRGSGSLQKAIEESQKAKVLVYSLVYENADSNLSALRHLSESTGGTYFVLFDEFPRLRAAYQKIAEDLAHRFTLVYRSSSDYSADKKPQIQVKMRNPSWRVRFQHTYHPN
jgi:Ca-activated chloride channel family protein